MTSFNLGFIDHAISCGLPEAQAVHMLKRAADHPSAQQLFKSLPNEQVQPDEDLEALTHLMHQDNVDSQMFDHLNNSLDRRLNQRI